jgi:hypothetical protein
LSKTESPVFYVNESGHLVVNYLYNGLFLTTGMDARKTLELLEMLQKKEKYIRKKAAEAENNATL